MKETGENPVLFPQLYSNYIRKSDTSIALLFRDKKANESYRL